MICNCGHTEDMHLLECDPPGACWAFLSMDEGDYCDCEEFEADPTVTMSDEADTEARALATRLQQTAADVAGQAVE